MSRLRSRAIPVGVGTFGLVLGVLAPVPVRTLVQTLVVAQASLIAIAAAVAVVTAGNDQFVALPDIGSRPSGFGPTLGKFGVSLLVDLGLFAVPDAPGAPVRGLTVGVALGLAGWGFADLFELESRLAERLDPTAALEDLVEDVEFESYRRAVGSASDEDDATRNPLLDLLGVAQTSLDRRDYDGAVRAVAALDEGTDRVVSGYAARDADDPVVLESLFDYWDRLGQSAVEGGTDGVCRRVVEAEANAARTALGTGQTAAFDAAFGSLARFCERATEADRMRSAYVEVLGDSLVAAVETDDGEAVALALDHLARMRETMEAVGPSAAPSLSLLTVQLLRAQRRLVETAPETIAEERRARSYALLEEATDRCVADLLVTDADVSAVGEAFARVGVAAAETDHQWIVRRVAMRIVDLRAAAEGRYDDADDHVEALHHAGGEDGVETAFDHIRETYGDGPAPTVDDPVSRLG